MLHAWKRSILYATADLNDQAKGNAIKSSWRMLADENAKHAMALTQCWRAWQRMALAHYMFVANGCPRGTERAWSANEKCTQGKHRWWSDAA
jgi:hypothetical protein